MPSAANTVISISNPTEMTRGVICSEMESGGIWSSERRKHIFSNTGLELYFQKNRNAQNVANLVRQHILTTPVNIVIGIVLYY